MPHLIADETVLFESPSPADIFCYTPALCRGFENRILAGFDLGGPGTEKLEGPRSDVGDYASGNQFRVLLSDDRGMSWRESSTRLPMWHVILFRAGKLLYALGHSGRLLISRSADNGESWSEPAVLNDRFRHHQSAGRVDFRHGKVYVAYERRIAGANWPGVAPFLMAAKEEDDLCNPAAWRFSEHYDARGLFAGTTASGGYPGDNREPGVLESNVLRIYDPEHNLYDPEDRTVLILMRTFSRVNGLAGLLKGVEHPDGRLVVEPVRTPEGTPVFLIPFPGGQMKFHLDYDPVSKLYWLVSTQAMNGYARHPLYGGERQRLDLFYSRNGLEFRLAGTVAVAATSKGSRHYASLLFDGDDLLVFSRSGDDRAKNPHDGNLLTFHRVKNFRNLVTD